MKAKRGFSKADVAAIRDGKILGIRAGTKPHRVIGALPPCKGDAPSEPGNSSQQ